LILLDLGLYEVNIYSSTLMKLTFVHSVINFFQKNYLPPAVRNNFSGSVALLPKTR